MVVAVVRDFVSELLSRGVTTVVEDEDEIEVHEFSLNRGWVSLEAASNFLQILYSVARF